MIKVNQKGGYGFDPSLYKLGELIYKVKYPGTATISKPKAKNEHTKQHPPRTENPSL